MVYTRAFKKLVRTSCRLKAASGLAVEGGENVKSKIIIAIARMHEYWYFKITPDYSYSASCRIGRPNGIQYTVRIFYTCVGRS